MRRETWKSSERRMAKALGGERVPVTGRGRGSAPDIQGTWFLTEHKAGKVLSSRLQLALAQAKAAAVGTGKCPIVTIDHHRAGPKGNIEAVMMLLDDWLLWFGGSKGD